jgi:hypothetical protein
MNLSHVQSTAARSRNKAPMTVAEYLSEQIHLCGKTQLEISREAGFNRPNIISMLKSGQTKLPITKIAPVAKALGVDPMHLFKMVMREYEPENWNAIENLIMGQPVLSQGEIELIELMRSNGVENPKIRSHEDEIKIVDTFRALAA